MTLAFVVQDERELCIAVFSLIRLYIFLFLSVLILFLIFRLNFVIVTATSLFTHINNKNCSLYRMEWVEAAVAKKNNKNRIPQSQSKYQPKMQRKKINYNTNRLFQAKEK